MRTILQGDNLDILPTLPAAFASVVYVDPPFNTGKAQHRTRLKVTASTGATDARERQRTGFGGRTYDVTADDDGPRYDDAFDDFESFLLPRIDAGLRCLTKTGSLFVHLDYREVHYIKVALDRLLGRHRFVNEIIWAYDYGGRPKNRWPAKHDTILWYAMDPKDYTFDFGAIDRIPYMAPGLVGDAKAAAGKTPTDVWWHTIVPTNGKEKTGYPTQKPLGILNRLVRVHSRPGDVVLDFFAGSGTTGEAAARNDRGFVLVDRSSEAVEVMARRLAPFAPEIIVDAARAS